MALKAKLSPTEHAALPEALRKEYAERDGAFFVDVIPVSSPDGALWDLQDVGGLQRTNAERKEKLDKANAKLAEFGSVTPAEAKAAADKLKSLDGLDEKGKIEAKWSEREKELNKAAEAEKQLLRDEAAALEQQLHDELVDGALTKAIAAKKGDVKLLVLHGRKYVKAVKNDKGRLEVRVLDATGQPRTKVNDKRQVVPMTIDDVVDMDLRTEFPRAFDAPIKSGGGPHQNDARRSGPAATNEPAAAGPFANPVDALREHHRTKAG